MLVGRARVYFRPEGFYFLFVVLFVLGGAVLRNVNLLVALAGLMVATLLIHYQLIVRQLAGLNIERVVPPRIGAGDPLEVEVTITRREMGGTVFALQYLEQIRRVQPITNGAPAQAKLFFPEIKAKSSVTQRYLCLLTQRGEYVFTRAELQCRYPFGLLEGVCPIQLNDRLIVCPRMGSLTRAWHELINAEHAGQERSRHRRGLLEAEFYALREWRNGDSRRWIHWRTSAKLGKLSVRQFEERDSCDMALVCDLWRPTAATAGDQQCVEEVIAFAATVLAEQAKQGGSRLTFILAGKVWQSWQASMSALFATELLEQLAVCEATETPDLESTEQRLRETTDSGTRVIVLSTRARSGHLRKLGKQDDGFRHPLEQALWLNASKQELQPYMQQTHVEVPA
jgi:uncharacterized protein (DUF58 family)